MTIGGLKDNVTCQNMGIISGGLIGDIKPERRIQAKRGAALCY